MKRTVTALALAIFVAAVALTFIPRALQASESEATPINEVLVAYLSVAPENAQPLIEDALALEAESTSPECSFYAGYLAAWMVVDVQMWLSESPTLQLVSDFLFSDLPTVRNDCVLSL